MSNPQPRVPAYLDCATNHNMIFTSIASIFGRVGSSLDQLIARARVETTPDLDAQRAIGLSVRS